MVMSYHFPPEGSVVTWRFQGLSLRTLAFKADAPSIGGASPFKGASRNDLSRRLEKRSLFGFSSSKLEGSFGNHTDKAHCSGLIQRPLQHIQVMSYP